MKKDLKMIKVEIRFFTNNIGDNGDVKPKHGWSCGFVTVPSNRRHGIKSGIKVPFHRTNEIDVAVKKAIEIAEITLIGE